LGQAFTIVTAQQHADVWDGSGGSFSEVAAEGKILRYLLVGLHWKDLHNAEL
jgi:hypothetical protein